MGNEWGSVVTNSDEVGGMTASIGVAGVGGVGCCSDSDAVGVCRWVGWECGSKIRAALEVSEYLELLLEVRASWVTVAGAEVDHLFTNTAYPTTPATGQYVPVTAYTTVTSYSCTSFSRVPSHYHPDSLLRHRSHNLQVVTFKQFCFLLLSSRLWVEFLDNCLK